MKGISWSCAALAAVLAAGNAAAGVMFKEKVSSNGFKGNGAFETTATREIEGLKAREDSATKFTGAVLKHFSGKEGRKSVVVTRVDLDKLWNIDDKKKSYTETSVTLPPREDENGDDKSAKEEKKSEPRARIKKTDFSVEKTGEKKTINGFDTQRYAAKLTVDVEDLKTKEVSTFRLVSDVWATPWTGDLKKARDEQKAYTEAYLKKLGVAMTPADAKAMAENSVMTMMGADQEETRKTLAKFRRELAKLDGYPVVTESSWYFAKPKNAPAPAAADDSDDSPNLSGGAGGLASSLIGGFAKKKMREKAAEDAGKPEISTRVELVEVAVKDLPKDDFEVPAGYKKK